MNTVYPSNVEANLKKLAEIKEKTPGATHIYLRRVDKDNMCVDIPIDQAEFTIRNKPAWLLEASNKQMDETVEKLFLDPPSHPPMDNDHVDEVPPKPSEILANTENLGVLEPKDSNYGIPTEPEVLQQTEDVPGADYVDKINSDFTPAVDPEVPTQKVPKKKAVRKTKKK